jgi:hypothetical protein
LKIGDGISSSHVIMFLELIANFMNGIFVIHGLDILHPFAKFVEYDSQV